MSRWIDAEWLKELYKPYEDFNGKMYSVPVGAILANIDDAPSIDIVKCGDCKHWKGDGVFTLNALGEEEQLCKWWSKFGTIRTAETAFCSYGERTEQIIKMPKADGSTIPKDYLRGESDENRR